MRIKLTATLTFLLLFMTLWMFGSHASAQRGRGTAARPNVSPTPPPTPTPSGPKIETVGGGPKIETKYDGRMTGGPAVLVQENVSTQRTTGSPATPRTAGLVASKPGSAGATTTSASIDVGVIPGSARCPPGIDLISIRMDSQDKYNANASSGWIGATAQDKNITFKFCRVDGSKFSTPYNAAYAVLQLNDSCPSGSVSFRRVFDNETDQNNNDAYVEPSTSSFGYSPNGQWKIPSGHSFTHLYFCVFLPLPYSSTPVGTPGIFPDLGMEYGVFAPSNFPGALATGWMDSDDEDWQNMNSYSGDYNKYLGHTGMIISGDKNTHIRFAKVMAGPPIPNLHSVSLNVSSVQGDKNGRNPILTVALDAPAPPGGMKVEVSSSEPNIAWVMGSGYFMIPEGQTSSNWEEFLGTRKVYSKKSLTLRVTVNSQQGIVNLDVTK